MLKLKNTQAGLTLIELMVGISVIGLLISLGISGMSTWVPNARIRATAQGIQSGLQLARAEAIKQNRLVRFQLTTSVVNGCSVSASGTNWVVSLNDVAGKCGTTPTPPPAPPEALDSANPYILQLRPSGEASGQVTVTADAATLTFGGMGRLVPPPAAEIAFDITSASGAACTVNDGPIRCLRILVSIGGQIRMCDSGVIDTTDPRGCGG